MKRAPQLRALSNEHHQSLVLARKAKNTGKDGFASVEDTWQEVDSHYQSVLKQHFQIEEDFIAKQLTQLGEKEMTYRLFDEHKQLKQLLESEQKTLESLVQFGELLEQHVRFEERELFQTAQNKLSEDDLANILNACSVEA
ncbi:hypothetical protein [Aliikangiella maris]|uniref:Uncharacterized protein n=2 Tax=Aliikangiella maris TaxID=3162458 RepID=A0ABV2BZG1_9GAMM